MLDSIDTAGQEQVMDSVVDKRIYQDEEKRTCSNISKHKNEDVGDIDVHDDLIYDIPDEDSILLVQVQGSSMSYKTKLVKSFSLTKVTYSIKLVIIPLKTSRSTF